MRIPVLMAALLAAATMVGACTGVPDRESEAQQIKNEIAAMPGVDDVSLIYDNDVLEGTRFELKIQMPGATDAQIASMAGKLDELRGDDFDGYDQRIEVSVAPATVMSLGTGESGDAAATARRLRELQARVPAGSIEWYPRSPSIRIRDAAAPGAAVDAVLTIFAASPAAEIEVSPADAKEQPYWTIRTEMTREQKQRIDQQLRRAAPPVIPGWIGISDGQITDLTIGLPRPESAYQDLVATIDAVGAGPAHPLSLIWSWRGDPAGYGELRWAGSAGIGKCEYADGDRTAGEVVVPEATALQQRIRDEFDSCPK